MPELKSSYNLPALAGYLVADLEGRGLVIRTIGDCVSPRRVTHANWDADRTVLELMRAGAQLRSSARAW